MARVLILSRSDDDGLPIRVAQLDLLDRSIERNWPDADSRLIDEPAGVGFRDRVQWELEQLHDDDLVCFATDDGCFYRPVRDRLVYEVMGDERTLCYALRLGAHTTTCYPTGLPQTWPGPWWEWQAGEGDYGYPGSVDGHVFRAGDLLLALEGSQACDPTALEAHLNEWMRRLFVISRPMMYASPKSCYVSVPVNQVSAQSGVRSGTVFPQPAGELAVRYEAGERISLERTFEGAMIDGAHAEVLYAWER